jgi:arginyl-tRNA synthetase
MARPDLLDPVLGDLAVRIRAALAAADLPEIDPALERPKQADHGDWATTAPLRLAKPAKRPPREIAQALVDHLELPASIEEVEIAGPGFVNFRFAHRYHQDLIRRVVAEGERFGRRTRPDDEVESVNVEFVSANPTGPLHVGAGRWAATGDAIAALLEADGHRVVREYYVNDAGEQIRRFGESIVLVAQGQPLTDDHYRGAVVGEIATELRDAHGDSLFDGDLDEVAPRVGALGVEAMRQRIEDVLHVMGVDFDVWFSRADGLHDRRGGGRRSRSSGTAVTYEADGAVFLRTDRARRRQGPGAGPLRRPPHLLRGRLRLHARQVDPRGGGIDRADRRPDPRGSSTCSARTTTATSLGCRPRPRASASRPSASRSASASSSTCCGTGEPVRMSKRAGETVDLDEVVDEVGVDVTRYHFLRQRLDTQVDFDLAVVAEQSMENPVYYVQYAHARINSLLRTADERGFDHGLLDDADLAC